MAKHKFGLGRGLDALIPGASEAMSAQKRVDENAILYAAIDSIIPNPRQPRRIFSDDDPRLLELSASIKEHGLLQPIVVTRLSAPDQPASPSPAPAVVSAADDWFSQEAAPAVGAAPAEPAAGSSGVVQFQIIAGERRWRAARLAGLSRVPVLIKEVTPLQMLELALIENIQRADLNPIEEALAYQVLVEEFGLTQEMVARQVGKDRSTITNAIRLLQLAPKVREKLINGSDVFTPGHARALIGIESEENQLMAMDKIISLKYTVRQAEELANRIKAQEQAEGRQTHVPAAALRRSPELDTLETHFRDSLMLKVDLKCNAKGKGTLVLHFNNQEELERLYNRLVKQQES